MTTEKPETSLTDLAEQANAAHAACEKAARSMLRHARDCGEVLLRVKARLPHGEFTPWIKENCAFTPRMARKYMTLANGWEQLAKRNHGSVLTLDSMSMREGLRLLAAGGPEETGEWQYVDADCPSCGARMVRTTHNWVTCPECWDCRLYGSVPGTMPGSTRPVGRKQKDDIFKNALRCAKQLDPNQRAQLVAKVFEMNKSIRETVQDLIHDTPQR